MITARLADLNAVLLAEPVEEHDSLLQHPIPGVSPFKLLQSQVLTGRLLAEPGAATQGTRETVGGADRHRISKRIARRAL